MKDHIMDIQKLRANAGIALLSLGVSGIIASGGSYVLSKRQEAARIDQSLSDTALKTYRSNPNNPMLACKRELLPLTHDDFGKYCAKARATVIGEITQGTAYHGVCGKYLYLDGIDKMEIAAKAVLAGDPNPAHAAERCAGLR